MKATQGRPIDVNVPGDMEYWTKALGVTHEQLVNAIAAVGPDSAAVSGYLKGGSRSEPPGTEQRPDGG